MPTLDELITKAAITKVDGGDASAVYMQISALYPDADRDAIEAQLTLAMTARMLEHTIDAGTIYYFQDENGRDCIINRDNATPEMIAALIRQNLN